MSFKNPEEQGEFVDDIEFDTLSFFPTTTRKNSFRENSNALCNLTIALEDLSKEREGCSFEEFEEYVKEKYDKECAGPMLEIFGAREDMNINIAEELKKYDKEYNEYTKNRKFFNDLYIPHKDYASLTKYTGDG